MLGTGQIYPSGSQSRGMVLLEDITLTVDVTAIAITGIPGDFKHLKLIGTGKSTTTFINEDVLVVFNADVAANYDRQVAVSSGLSVSGIQALAVTTIKVGEFPGQGSDLALAAGAFELTLMDYAGNSFNKAGISQFYSPFRTTGQGGSVGLAGVSWRSISAISSITILSASYGLKAGSRFTLYALT